MVPADHGGHCPDLYQLLGAPRHASREEIAQAWRRRAREEQPAVQVTIRRPPGPGGTAGMAPLAWVPAPPLRYLAGKRGRPC